jgi:hypothetical protein
MAIFRGIFMRTSREHWGVALLSIVPHIRIKPARARRLAIGMELNAHLADEECDGLARDLSPRAEISAFEPAAAGR